MAANSRIVTRSVPYQHGGAKLEGYLAYDEARTGEGRRPGVLVLPEWWGLVDYPKARAEQIAKLGYVAFVADMYGVGVTTRNAKKASELADQFYGKPLMAERARAALEQLLATGLVDASRVAAIGYCFGGSTAQALAWSGAPLAGVVSFHGGLIPPPAAGAPALVLICHGAIDPFVEPEELDAFKRGADAAKLDYQFISYSGAVHAFSNPEADKLGPENGIPIRYNPAADRRSWRHMVDFLAEIFAEKQ